MAFASATLAALLTLAPSSDAPSSAGPADPATDSAEAVKRSARRAFDEGLAAVASGEYEGAVTAFERAYELRPHPVTLFNLALALEKAERLPEAWGLFAEIIEVVESNAERREIRRHMRAIEDEIAIVEIDARPRARLCIDGLDMPAGETSDYRLAIEPGRHELLLDSHAITLEFEAGDRRVLLLDDAHEYVAGRRRSRLMPAMLGTAITASGAAIGLGVGAAMVSDEGLRTGLAAGAAGSAGLALIGGLVALLVETRTVRDPTTRRVAPSKVCPGAPALEQRLDLRLGPTIASPVEFAALPLDLDALPEVPTPSFARAATFPHPRGLAPPRAGASPSLTAQNRPTSTTPI